MRQPRHDANDPFDALYEVPIGQFVARRNAIAQQLAEAGKASAANAVRATAKPKATVWAINQTARIRPKEMKAFVTAFDALKRAQLREPGKVSAATQALRRATETVIRHAREAMIGAGVRSTLDTERRLGATLRGAAASGRDTLLRGALTEEVASPGFEVFGDAVPRGTRHLRSVRATKPPARDPALDRDDLLRRRAEQLDAEAKATDERARHAGSEAMEARRRLRELEQRARESRRAAAKTRRTATAARRRATEQRGRRAGRPS